MFIPKKNQSTDAATTAPDPGHNPVLHLENWTENHEIRPPIGPYVPISVSTGKGWHNKKHRRKNQ